MRDDRQTSTTIASILQGRLAGRFFGDGPPTWRQGRNNNPCATADDANRAASRLVLALRRDGSDAALDLADAIERCRPARPCLSGACPKCARAAQRLFVAATSDLPDALGDNVLVAAAIDVQASVAVGALDGGNVFAPIRRRLARALADCRAAAVGGFDVTLNMQERAEFATFWAPHAHIVISSRRMRAAEDRFRAWFRGDELTPRPVRIQKFDCAENGRAYLLIPDFNARISLEPRPLPDGSRSTFSTRNKPIWGDQRVELALALDQAGLDARLFLRGCELVEWRSGVEIRRRPPTAAAPPSAPEPRASNGDRRTRP